MVFSDRFNYVAVILCFLVAVRQCSDHVLQSSDKTYHLVSEAYSLAKKVFDEGSANYDRIKNKSQTTINIFLDLVRILNDQMARDVRAAVIKYYKIKYFYDFTNYVIALDEMVEITEHCLEDPVARLKEIQESFQEVISNFQDNRQFSSVNQCRNSLPDEVAVAHCILHQAVLFNETMQDNLAPIVSIKTRQHAQDINDTIFGVQDCFNAFVPKFFEQLLLDSYSSFCEYLKVINASVYDLAKERLRLNETNNPFNFPAKWGPLVTILKEKTGDSSKKLQEPLFLTLFSANLSSEEILQTLY